MNIKEAKKSLDKVIDKARVHLYKPIQIAEILHRDRTEKDINLSDLTTYRNSSKKWRDIICIKFLGRTSTSSARYQDDIFNDNANRVIQLSSKQTSVKLKARINRVGVTNAADRGLDMWANFGLAIQIKHLSLTEEIGRAHV